MFDPKISYVLRELADWIEHRTGGEDPSDTSRIELARQTATKVEELEGELDRFKTTLDRLALSEKQRELFEAEEGWTKAADKPATPFVVGKAVAEPPPDPVERCECSTLTFDLNPTDGTMRATCDKGKVSKIPLDSIKSMVTHPDDIVLAVAQQIAKEHGLPVQELFVELKPLARSDLKTITVGTHSLPTR